jgi:hypothetical protein
MRGDPMLRGKYFASLLVALALPATAAQLAPAFSASQLLTPPADAWITNGGPTLLGKGE